MKLYALALLSLPALASADAIDDLVRAEMKKANIPGMAVGIVKNGKTVKLKGYGFANLEHKVPVKPDTIFQSGSVGKQFTSGLVMLLVQEGKLRVDDPITKFFPEAKGKWDGVKVYHLLNHTSGLPNMPYREMDMRKDYTEDELVKLLLDREVVAKPGDSFAYNNGGYVLLGVMVGRVTGTFYGDVLQEKIFQPLGMKTARIITEQDIVLNRAAGYVPSENGLKNQNWVAPKLNTTADGSIYLSLEDMLRWDAGLAPGKLFLPETLKQMWTPTMLNDGSRAMVEKFGYGFGWAVTERKKAPMVFHGGSWQGFMSWISRVPERKTTLVLLTNRSGAPLDAIAEKILDLIDPAK